jgi:hypothetical protein
MQETRHSVKNPPCEFARAAVLGTAIFLLSLAPAPAAEPQAPLPQAELPGTAILLLPSPVGPLAYTPGRGLRVGETRVTIGGYTNINLIRDEGGPANLKWDDLSLFTIWDPLPRLHLFSELEFEDIVQVDDHGRGGTVDHVFTVERLYGDVAASEYLNVRFGKFLTPVGRWNVIHAQPLVWTTSRPLVTLLPFDTHVTGAMLFGTLLPQTSAFTYSVYGQFLNEFERLPEEQQADRSAGLRLEYGVREGWACGASYQSFSHARHWAHLGGLDTVFRQGPVELMGEAVFEDTTGAGAGATGVGQDWGLYLQTVLQVRPTFFLVGRYEHFDQRAPQPAVNLVVLGVAYKPAAFVILKAEYLIADRRAEESPPGFKSSLAILF